MKKYPLLIPVQKATAMPGYFRWPDKPVLASPTRADDVPLNQVAETLRSVKSCSPRIDHNAFGPAALRVRRDRVCPSPEGYRLNIDPGGIEIVSGTCAGAYYAVQTLRELIGIHGRRIPAMRIRDLPDFERRGVYLDCSRGKVPTVETLKGLVEYLGRLKINELQLYVENVFTFQQHPRIGKGFSPFTPEELLDVQEHCKRHHVRFVPSLSSFGHFERILSHPDYSHLGEKPGHLGYPGGTTLCPGDPGSIKLVADLYKEYLPLFESIDFNACCDETWELGQGRSRRRAQRAGLGTVYLDYIRKLHRLCLDHGKRMNIWADIVLNHPRVVKDIPRDIVMLNWDYEPDGSRIPRTGEFERAGLSCLVCPGTHGWQSHGTRLATAMENVKVSVAEGKKRNAEGVLNTDWGDFGHRNTIGVSLHGFAHAAAHAWNGGAVDDAAFTDTFCFHVFGSSGRRLAGAIRMLGDSPLEAGVSLYRSFEVAMSNRGYLFRGIPRISPVWLPVPYRKDLIDSASLDGCRNVMERLNDRFNKVFKEIADPFIKAAQKELILAAQMDALASRRIVAAKLLRNGKAPASEELKALSSGTRRLMRDFERTWLLRNKPSRLRDNLKLFTNGLEECERLRGR